MARQCYKGEEEEEDNEECAGSCHTEENQPPLNPPASHPACHPPKGEQTKTSTAGANLSPSTSTTTNPSSVASRLPSTASSTTTPSSMDDEILLCRAFHVSIPSQASSCGERITRQCYEEEEEDNEEWAGSRHTGENQPPFNPPASHPACHPPACHHVDKNREGPPLHYDVDKQAIVPAALATHWTWSRFCKGEQTKASLTSTAGANLTPSTSSTTTTPTTVASRLPSTASSTTTPSSADDDKEGFTRVNRRHKTKHLICDSRHSFSSLLLHLLLGMYGTQMKKWLDDWGRYPLAQHKEHADDLNNIEIEEILLNGDLSELEDEGCDGDEGTVAYFLLVV
ncbi:hypothetical protein LSTR_LSTR015373 [Laodelphax striatellus]|uniref:Uncharacterized protein n=1 Tax=Laodelphax striatellus TaxID=195883 RepID=A0A482XD03_LAOST|nr:hypothetical protein LSTR_LSTR015373 [Laodelphax striatellus]